MLSSAMNYEDWLRQHNLQGPQRLHMREWREAHALTQSELALRLGVDVSLISRIERGTRDPSMLTLQRLALEFQCQISDLFRKPDL